MDKLRILFGVVFILGACGGVSADIDTLTAELDPEAELEHMGDWCSLGCAMGWHETASSYLAPQGGNYYDAARFDDGVPSTAWVEGVDGYGIGEYMFLYFTEEDFHKMDSINLWGFNIVNGYCKNEKTWQANSRVKFLKVYHNDAPLFYIRLHDSMYLQSVGFAQVWLKPGDEIKAEIKGIYPGTKYDDTAVSEFIPLGAH